jgi:FkbM family methyltransferase
MCGFWDWRVHAIAAALCRPGDTIIEVGANTGSETVEFAKIVGQRGRVIAFEPLPELAAALRQNVRINGYGQVATIEAAVPDFNGSVCIQDGDAGNSGQGHIASDGVPVPATTLDVLIPELGRASFISIDVEGHEVAVLRGAREYIQRERPAIIVEAIEDQLVRGGSSMKELIEPITSMGYIMFQVNRTSVEPLDIEKGNALYHQNWQCLPRIRRGLKRRVNTYLAACAFMPGFLHPLYYLPQ